MRKALVSLAAFVGLGSVALTATPAFAASAGVQGSLTYGSVTYYSTARTITVANSNIYVQKVDGPEIDVMWYKCGDRSVHGAWVNFPNDDPTARKRIGAGFRANTRFCLAARTYGRFNSDTWAGTLWWNVTS